MSWTDTEMKERLELMGYDLTDDQGNYDHSTMVDIASHTEGYKWDEKNEIWHE